MTYYATDPLQDSTGSDHTLIGQAVASDPSKTWGGTFAGVASSASMILKAASPKPLSFSTANATNHIAQADPSGQVGADQVKIIQAPLQLLAGSAAIQGVGIYNDNSGIGGVGTEAIFAGVTTIGGTPSWAVYQNDTTNGTVLLASGALPFTNNNNLYCVRYKQDLTRGRFLYVASMDEFLNPNNVFNNVWSDNSLHTPTSPVMGLVCYAAAANFTNANYVNPQYSDGSFPYQFFAQSYNGQLNAQFQIQIKPLGYGWIATGILDFTQSNIYSYTFPNVINDSRAFFTAVEVINIGNASSVKIQLGPRTIVVPPNQTLWFNMDQFQYQQIVVSASDGACRLNAYDSVAVQYQSIR